MNNTNLQDKENIPRGYLKFKNQVSPVYDGINTVGRNPEAIINIKNISISQHHGLIIIVDENTHFISDLKSSNGIILDNKVLSPLKLYKLNNGASIKFANIHCTYARVNKDDDLLQDLNETQNCTQSLYAASTQAIELPTPNDTMFNDLPTQLITSSTPNKPLSINDMPTQLMNPLSINDMPTQVFHFNEESKNDASSDDSIDFNTMQKVAESQNLHNLAPPEVASGSSIAPVQLNVAGRSVLNSEPDLDATPEIVSQIQPVVLNKKPILLSDSEDEEPASQICPVVKGSKKVIESDDFDTEEPIRQANKSKYVISDDSETDIEDNDGNKTVEDTDTTNIEQDMPKPDSPKNITNELNSMSSFRLEISETIEDDDKENQNQEERGGKDSQSSSRSKRRHSGAPEDHLYCKSLENTQNTQTQLLEENPNPAEPNRRETPVDSILSTVDRLIEEDLRSLSQETDLNAIQNGKESSPVQTLFEKQTELETVGLREKDTEQDRDDDETQSIGPDTPQINDKIESQREQDEGTTEPNVQANDVSNEVKTDQVTSPNEKEELLKDISNDILGVLIQQPESDVLGETDKGNSNDKPSTPFQQIEPSDRADDAFDEPTQELELDSTSNKSNKGKNDDEKENPNQGAVDKDNSKPSTSLHQTETTDKTDDVFDQPTQQLQLDLTDSKANKDQNDDDIYHQATQKDNKEDAAPLNKSDDDIYIQSTQQLAKPDTEPNKKETAIRDDVFLRPFVPIGSEKPSTSKEYNDDSDEDILPPTQALEILHRDNEKVSDEPNSNPGGGVEDQLEMLFYSQSDHMFVATQQLVSVLEEKNDDVIADSFLEDSCSDLSKNRSFKTYGSKKQKFDTVDSVRKSLDGSFNSSFGEDGSGDKEAKQDEELGVPTTPEKNKSKEQQEKAKEEIRKSPRRAAKALDIQESRSRTRSERAQSKKEEEVEVRTKNGKSGDEKIKARKEGQKQGVEKTEDKRTTRAKKDKEIPNDNKKTNVKKSSTDEETGSRQSRSRKKQDSDDIATVNEEVTVEDRKTNTRTTLKSKDKETEPAVSVPSKDDKKNENEDFSEDRGRRQVNLRKKQNNVVTQDEEAKADKGKAIVKTKSTGEEMKDKTKSVNETSSEQVGTRQLKSRKKQEDNNAISKDEDARAGKGKTDATVKSKGEEIEDKRKNERATEQIGTRQSRSRKKEDNNNTATKDDDNKVAKATSSRSSRVLKSTNSDINLTTSALETRVSARTRKNNENADENTEIPKKGQTMRKRKNDETVDKTRDSGDEFEPKVQRISPVKANKEKALEIPTSRKSSRRKNTKSEDDVSLASTSSLASISSSSVSEEPVRKARRLSANSRVQKNEDEKGTPRGRKMAEKKQNEVSTPSSDRSKRILKPKVVFTMLDDPGLESAIRQLGGSVVDTVDACTVLVTGSVKRSHKLLCAVGQGKPICSPEWLTESKRAFTFLDPWDFILEDAEAENKWDFSLRESLKRGGTTKLLTNYTFQLIVNKAADVLKGAIESCGGKCVTRNLAKSDSEHVMIVSSSENKSKYEKIVKQNSAIRVVEPEAIFDGTLRQEFRFNHFLVK